MTSPTKNGNLTVYPGSGSEPTVSNLNFTAGETVPSLVTVQVTNGEVSLHNNSAGTVEVIADLEGFYGASGFGYQHGTPPPASSIPATGPVPPARFRPRGS